MPSPGDDAGNAGLADATKLRRRRRGARLPARAAVGERRELLGDRDAEPLLAKRELDLPVQAVLAPPLDSTVDALGPDERDATAGKPVVLEVSLDPRPCAGDGFLPRQPRVLLARSRRVVEGAPEPDRAELREQEHDPHDEQHEPERHPGGVPHATVIGCRGDRREWVPIHPPSGILTGAMRSQPGAVEFVLPLVGGRLQTASTARARRGARACARLGARPGRQRAEPRPQPLRVLFIGNSQTSTNDLPAFVAAIAKASKQVTIEYRTIAPSAVTLQGNWNHGSARGVAARRALGRGRAAAGTVRPPREPREPLLLREGVRGRGARVGGAPVPADGVAAARVGPAGGGRRVRVGRGWGRHRAAAGRRRVGRSAAAGA